MNQPFIPTPAYRIFLARLIETREERGFTQSQLAEFLGLTPVQVAAFENGEVPLGFIETRSWLLALDMPFVEFTKSLDEELDATLTNDETIIPSDSADQPHIAPDRPFNPPQSYIHLITRLKEARLACGLLIADIAVVMGIGHGWATQAENLEWPVDFTMLRKWCEMLDVPFAEFVQSLADEDTQALELPIPAPQLTSPTNQSNSMYDHMTTPPDPEIPTIEVLFFAIDAAPEVLKIPNTLEAKQELVGGLITTFETGIEGTVGIANDEALVMDMEPNRLIPATGAPIFGPFLVVGDDGPNFRSLTPHELEKSIDNLAPEVPQADFTAIMRTHSEGQEWMDMWN